MGDAIRPYETLDAFVSAAAPVESGEAGEADHETFSESFQAACFLIAELNGELTQQLSP